MEHSTNDVAFGQIRERASVQTSTIALRHLRRLLGRTLVFAPARPSSCRPRKLAKQKPSGSISICARQGPGYEGCFSSVTSMIDGPSARSFLRHSWSSIGAAQTSALIYRQVPRSVLTASARRERGKDGLCKQRRHGFWGQLPMPTTTSKG